MGPTGEVRIDGADGIACWLFNTDYYGESFFVRHADFLGQNDPNTALKTTADGGGQPGGMGHAAQRHVSAVREAQEREDRGEGDQSPRG